MGTSTGTDILVVTAHPDDVDFGAGGSVAVWCQEGSKVSYCIVTDGDAGGDDRSVPRDLMRSIRQAEQQAAGAVLGVSDIHFLGYPDGRLMVDIALRRDISRVIRQLRPKRVVCQSPERNWSRIFASHPDHLAAGEAALCAVYPDARNPFAHPELLTEEGLEPHTVEEVWVMAWNNADMWVDVTDTFELKLKALREHKSQVGEGAELEGMLRPNLERHARTGGLPAGRLAEGFMRVKTG